ncbi:hypothetical protein IFR05_012137 [Cadophora sp. M221]|nr:hypothetical protein IFR05_012137 [Cadophora sp. M221]
MSLTLKGHFQEWLSRHVPAKNTKPNATCYEHTPFEDETSIRLPYLQPGKFDDDINIKLEVVSLDNPPPYRALSYVWGPPPHETLVFCDGNEFLVSESCVAALRRLREEEQIRCGSVLRPKSLVKCVTDRPWFERVWTVQEYTLSRDSRALCGGKAIDFSRLLVSVQNMANRRIRNGEPTYIPSTLHFHAYYTYYSLIWKAIHANGTDRIMFTDLLIRGGQLKARDPKDVLFGLHGILQKFQIAIPPPDYSKSVEDVLTEATRSAILYDISLSALLHCSNGRARDGLPSWVPDWSTSEQTTLLPSALAVDCFKASRENLASFSFPDEEIKVPASPSLLSVHGVVVDTLTYCA